jgi:hypothetical protein
VVIDVHPSVGINPPGPTTREPFAPAAVHELKIDTNGDGVAEVAFRTHFSAENGGQPATVRRNEGADAAGIGDSGEAVVVGAPVSFGSEAQVTESRRVSVLRRLAQRPVLLRRGGCAERVSVHRQRLLRGQGRVQHRARVAERRHGSYGKGRALASDRRGRR